MATDLPLSFRASPLPSNFQGTPQQLLDAMVARLGITTQDQLALFVNGSVAPTSDQGPFIKNGQTWWVWDSGTGAYIPQVIDPLSLKYIATASTPDHTKYTFWIVLDGGGKATAIKYYSGGAWKDVYEDKFALIALTTKAYPCRAHKSGAVQNIANNVATKITFNTEDFDPDSVFASSTFTAPVTGYYSIKASASFSKASGTPGDIDIQLKIYVNGGFYTRSPGQTTTNTGGATFAVSDVAYLTAGQTVEIYAQADTANPSTWDIEADSFGTFFEVYRLQG